MSTGDLKVEGDRAHYELRIPMYEVAHVHNPDTTLLQHVRFKSGGAWAKPSNASCSNQQDTYVCTADYQFPARGCAGYRMHPGIRDGAESRAPAAGVSRRQERSSGVRYFLYDGGGAISPSYCI